jgi:hypothetical protein
MAAPVPGIMDTIIANANVNKKTAFITGSIHGHRMLFILQPIVQYRPHAKRKQKPSSRETLSNHTCKHSSQLIYFDLQHHTCI